MPTNTTHIKPHELADLLIELRYDLRYRLLARAEYLLGLWSAKPTPANNARAAHAHPCDEPWTRLQGESRPDHRRRNTEALRGQVNSTIELAREIHAAAADIGQELHYGLHDQAGPLETQIRSTVREIDEGLSTTYAEGPPEDKPTAAKWRTIFQELNARHAATVERLYRTLSACAQPPVEAEEVKTIYEHRETLPMESLKAWTHGPENATAGELNKPPSTFEAGTGGDPDPRARLTADHFRIMQELYQSPHRLTQIQMQGRLTKHAPRLERKRIGRIYRDLLELAFIIPPGQKGAALTAAGKDYLKKHCPQLPHK